MMRKFKGTVLGLRTEAEYDRCMELLIWYKKKRMENNLEMDGCTIDALRIHHNWLGSTLNGIIYSLEKKADKWTVFRSNRLTTPEWKKPWGEAYIKKETFKRTRVHGRDVYKKGRGPNGFQF